MKISKRQLVRIIKEQSATVDDDKIDDVVMTVLGDEGGAAGLEPIEDALEELEDDEISLPEESIEDLIAAVTGVKQHADGDYVDTTQLEGKGVKLTTSRLRRIVKEEKRKMMSELHPRDVADYAYDKAEELGVDPDRGIFDSNYLYDMFYDEFAEVQPTSPNVSPEAFQLFEAALAGAVAKLKRDLVR